MFKEEDIVRWFLNPHQYVLGVVVEVCEDGTYWVEHSNRQQRNYKESELMLDKSTGGKGVVTMTEQEAKLILDVRISRFDHAEDVNEALEIAKQALEEIQQYRKIGTVEECREAREKQMPKAPKDSLKIEPVIDENGAYVDADTTVYILCPNCGELVGMDEDIDRFCRECGQAIQWNENTEENI